MGVVRPTTLTCLGCCSDRRRVGGRATRVCVGCRRRPSLAEPETARARVTRTGSRFHLNFGRKTILFQLLVNAS